MADTYMKKSFIYWVKGHRTGQRKQRCKRNNVYMNGEHGYAGSEDNKNEILYYNWT